MTTPTTTQCNARSYDFGRLNHRPVVADFSAPPLSSDGGLLLIRQIDQIYGISERLAACFSDQRDPKRVQHRLVDLIAQRLYGLVQGYEDLNDHDQLRHDPIFQVALEQTESRHPRCAPLAGKSTLNRLEQAMHVKTDLREERYLKYCVFPQQVEAALVEVFIGQVGTPPQQVILDLDVSNDEVHGEQVLAGYNGYYDQRCYTPLYIFSGRHLLAAHLRPANVDPAEGSLEALQRVTAQIRQYWPEVSFIVRGDSAYGREEIMSWCEGQPHIEYVLAHASNARLVRATHTLSARAQAAYQQHRQAVASRLSPLLEGAELSDELDALVPPQVWYQSLHYRTHTSWSRARRVVCKLTYGATGVHRHFVVTSLPLEQVRTGQLHRDCYAPRGEMENRIKEHQLDLFSDRTSTHEFESNQLRLWFSSFAYVLLQALRQHALATTELADAQLGTIRLKLLKLAAQVRISARRIHIAFSRVCPSQALFQRAYDQLYRLARPG